MNKDDLPNDIGNRFSPTPLPFLSFSLFCSLCSPIKNEFQSSNELTYKVLEISRIFSGVTQYPRYEITRRRCRIYTRGKNQIGKEHDMVSFLEISSRGNVACIEKKSSNGAAMTNDKQWSSTWRMSAGRTFSVFCLAMLVILVKRMGKKFSEWNTYLVIFVRDILYVCNIVRPFCWEYSPRDFCS